jgi:Spy/CpxP family protein refolding chaperone
MSQNRSSAARLWAIAVAAAASMVAAVPWDASEPTPTSFDAHDSELGWTPRPTSQAGWFPGIELFRRQEDPAMMSICGYVNQDRGGSNAPLNTRL